MATTSALRIRLVQIRQELAVSPVMMFGRSNDDSEQEKQAARLDKLSDNLRVIIRDLKSSANLIQLQQQALWQNVPKQNRWSASASLKQQSEDIGGVLREAEGLLKVVFDLLRKNGLGNPMQVAHDLSDLMENFEKVFGHEAGVQIAEIQQISKGPSYVPGHGAEPLAMEPHQLVPLLAVAYLGMKWLVKKWRHQ